MNNDGEGNLSVEKPKALLLRPSLDGVSNHFKDAGFYNRERCLSIFFDLTVCSENFDLKTLITAHDPELIIIMYDPSCQGGLLEVSNKDFGLQIPRVLIALVDGYSLYRWNAYYTFRHLAAEAIFTVDTSFGAYFPQLKDVTFQWHNFVDPAIFHNYCLPKVVDVLLTGSFLAANYPWRRSVFKTLKQFNFNELVHWNRDFPSHSKSAVVKDEYSKAINQSKIVPTCGGHSKILVGKHLEIPASFSCLVTEESEALKVFGFKHGENCLFVNAKTIESEIQSLLSDDKKLETITSNGYELVMKHHTSKHRSELLDWFNLYQKKTSLEKIVQLKPFLGLALTDKASDKKNFFVQDVPPVFLSKEGDRSLLNGQIDKAIEQYSYFKNIDQDAAIVVTRLGLIYAYQKQFSKGHELFRSVIMQEVVNGNAAICDPIELFVFCLSIFKQGKFELVADLCLYAIKELDKISSMSIHLEVILNLAQHSIDRKVIGLRNKITNYKFCSSHEFLNVPYFELVLLLKEILKLKREQCLLIEDLPLLSNSNLPEFPVSRLKDRADFVKACNTVLFKLSRFQLLKYYSRRLLQFGSKNKAVKS